MSDYQSPQGSVSILKQRLLEALRTSMEQPVDPGTTGAGFVAPIQPTPPSVAKPQKTDATEPSQNDGVLSKEEDEGEIEPPLPEELQQSRNRLLDYLQEAQEKQEVFPGGDEKKSNFDDTLTKRGVVPDEQTETLHPAGAPSSSIEAEPLVKFDTVISGGSMADLSGYKDLSKAPISFGDDDLPMSNLASEPVFERQHAAPSLSPAPQQHFVQPEAPMQEVDTEFSGNVKTLIRLVNELPEGVTKQTGAQIIRLTMEAMGISMEDVLSEAQSAQSEMLDAVRANIKKIEEYKTVIRKLETDIKYYQGKANELSEIIDLFILSNTTGNKMSVPDDLS